MDLIISEIRSSLKDRYTILNRTKLELITDIEKLLWYCEEMIEEINLLQSTLEDCQTRLSGDKSFIHEALEKLETMRIP